MNWDTTTATAPAGLDPRVIARMDPADRTALIALLGRYLEAETEGQADGQIVEIK
ncbi:MAG: hypothetical protein IOC63_09485 [Methylobacterium sp.]|nr:hypothetical protein [Methylobacterium sp.]